MTVQHQPTHRDAPARRLLLIWVALLGPAAAWFAQLCANYTLAAYACSMNRMWILHSISGGAALLTVVGMACSWRLWRTGRRTSSESSSEARSETQSETSWLAVFTLLLGAMFLLGIAWSELANWLLVPCE
jgi:hypothetical protein